EEFLAEVLPFLAAQPIPATTG
ncbi:MAG: hypothetical protein QOF99_8193, partial [Pseudonocardiales bacterium]|nr:hypothetical protein [Pseudonocardiales bacterium]